MSMTIALSDTSHQERHFEAYIVHQLTERGWLVGQSSAYDQNHALYPEDLVEWIRSTQPKKWDKLVAANGAKATATLMARLEKALELEGTVQILRNGFKIANAGEVALSEGLPEDNRDPSAWERYKSNRLRVVPQLHYRPGSKLAIDLVFFINGLPVATVELKTDFTQSTDAAVEQYKNDRLPKDTATGRIEPLLTFKRGAVVHFAMSDSDIRMTTKLAGPDTYFLPFNTGRDGHAGNPAGADGNYPVAYFWEQVCAPDNWLRIFHSFVYTEKKDVVDLAGNHHRRETQIFPRFHQWDAVTKMIADAKSKGPGQTYLCEHSAGSGKTSTIAWTAHDLIRLRTPDKGEPYFHSVIIVTDRTVLDKQLQDAVQQIDHQYDLIAAIGDKDSGESKSKELAYALERGTPIIVVTIQTFPYAMEQILTNGKLAGRSFAVIIDEAHTSQTGTAASKLQATLALRDAKAMEGLTVDELLEKIQASRVRPKNVSYFAFTATPKHATMMLFGRPIDPTLPASKENPPQSFHKYPMRQAIEEGFILDVLKGYLPYKTAFNLAEPVREGKRVDNKAAKRALAKWLNLHATNVTQKVEFIVEHFAANVAPLLGGTAKAMIVTSSRSSAVRYKKAFDAYIQSNPRHKAYQALVAFSGSLTGNEIVHNSDALLANDVFTAQDDEQFTEANMNPREYGSDLRKVFDRPEFRVMIVANKFQTGFDQPKLCAMYLDKKIANPVEIVQTLSRLNRVAPGKDTTFVVDFVNEPQAILDAFAKYDAGARIEEVQDPNVIYDLQSSLDKALIYTEEEVKAYTAVRFHSAQAYAAGEQSQHKALYAATSAPTMRFNSKVATERTAIEKAEAAYEVAKQQGNEAGIKASDAQRAKHAEQLQALMDFKSGLTRFGSLYTYIAQTIDLGDPSMEAFASFARLLSKRLDGVPPDQVDVSALVLTGFDIKATDLPSDVIDPDIILKPVGTGGGGQVPMPVYLGQIIERLNSIFGEARPLADKVAFVNHIADITREDPHTAAQIANNPRNVAMEGNIFGTVQAGVVRAMMSHANLAEHVMKHDQQAMAPLVNLVYEIIKEGKNIDLVDLDRYGKEDVGHQVNFPRDASSAFKALQPETHTKRNRVVPALKNNPAPSADQTTATEKCFFRAEMDHEVILEKIATVEVILSREIIGKVLDATAVEEEGNVDTSKKIIVQLRPKLNFQTEGEDYVETSLPARNEPLHLYFDVRSTHLGEGEVWVIVRQGQVPLATMALKPKIVETKSRNSRRELADTISLGAPQLTKPIHQLTITERRNGNELRYHYQLQSPELKLLEWGESKPFLGDRESYVKKVYEKIEDRWLSTKTDVENFYEELRAIGAEMFDELIPSSLQVCLWKYREQISSIFVISEEPFIPWELVHLHEPGQPLTTETNFFGQMGLVRWLHEAGWPNEEIQLRENRAHYVIPRYPDPGHKLPEAEEEAVFLEKTFAAKKLGPTIQAVRKLLSSPDGFDLLHFACHGSAAVAGGNDAVLLLEGRMEYEQYIPETISSTTVGQYANFRASGSRPMVVINACQTGRLGYNLTGIGGFAHAFLKAGAGAFVAALWSVGDRPARTFTEELYDQLSQRATISEATIKAREAARRAGDATWLSYVVYGHPHGKFVRP